MDKIALLLLFVCVPLFCCYETNQNPYDDEYEGDGVIEKVLNSFHQDQSNGYNSYKRTEEYAKDKPTRETISMPGVSPQEHDSYFCYGQKIKSDEFYIGFQPSAEEHTAHHMLLFGCEKPFKIDKTWTCREMNPVCSSGSQHILYAWGKNAPPLKLPKDVGFKVGPSTNIKYLVLQVHYGKVDKFVGTDLKDYSGVAMDVTKKPLTLRAGIFILAEGYQSIPPHEPKWHLDTGCPYEGEATIYPFAARVHAHHLATVVSGYRVRNGKWTLIRKESPQIPQAFYRVDKRMKIKPGDHLEARCTYNSMKKDVVTKIGATMNDEMCNFYIMFFYDSKKYTEEPPGMCRWGNLDDNVKFPKGSDKLDEKRKGDHTPSQDKPLYSIFPKWGDGFKFGQISGVAVDRKGFVVVFHRANREWTASTFNSDNVFNGDLGPIKQDTLVWLNAVTGKVIMKWGKDKFYLPHGLTVDHSNNIWLTDVGLHQVFKYNLMKSQKPLLALGKPGRPGSDSKHFCKPTDVAVDRTGVFYVSDGYCNNRIMMFSSFGQLLKEINDNSLAESPLSLSPPSFRIPHSVSLDETSQLLYVADRENGRILVFNALNGKLIRSIASKFDTIYAISCKGGKVYGVSGPNSPRGFTYDVKSDTFTLWAEFTRPHDIAVSRDGQEIYVGEIGPNKLWKFKKNTD